MTLSIGSVNIPVEILIVPGTEVDLSVYDEKIKKYFIYKDERPNFKDIVTLAYSAINEGYTNIFIEAPVGSGKAGMVKTLGEALGGWFYVLAPNLALQKQYLSEQGELLVSLKGKSNFQCISPCGICPDRKNRDRYCSPPCNCSEAPCRYKEFSCYEKDKIYYELKNYMTSGISFIPNSDCQYYNQYALAVMSKRVLSNPAYLFRVLRGSKCLINRNVTFIDECHLLPDIFKNLGRIHLGALNWGICFSESFPSDTDREKWRDRLKLMRSRCNKMLEDITKEIIDLKREMRISSSEIGELSKDAGRINSLLGKLDYLIPELELGTVSIIPEIVDEKIVSITFTPFIAAATARINLDKASNVRVFLSASLRDINFWITEFGIEDQSNLFIKCEESSFPVENRPVMAIPVGSMSLKNREATIPKMCIEIEEILRDHKGVHGLILPFSYQISKDIYAGVVRGKSRLILHSSNKDDRDTSIESFLTGDKKDSVLLSPSLGTGFDGINNRVRFLILCKTPFGNLGDILIRDRIQYEQRQYNQKTKCKMSLGKNGLCNSYGVCDRGCMSWYNMVTALQIIQFVGRGVRNELDWCDTYILDADFKTFFRDHKRLFPEYLRSAIKFC